MSIDTSKEDLHHSFIEERLKDRRTFVDYAVLLLVVLSPIVILIVHPTITEKVHSGLSTPLWLYFAPGYFLAAFLLVVVLYVSKVRGSYFVFANGVLWFLGALFLIELIPDMLREDASQKSANTEVWQQRDSLDSGLIRALSLFSARPQYLNHPEFNRLIHEGLLDKDPRVQHAARIVIEENFGIKLENGALGIRQALELFDGQSASAKFSKEKGSP